MSNNKESFDNAENCGKIFSKNNIKAPPPGRCGFFVKRKQRFCRMLPSKGSKYCAEHMAQDEISICQEGDHHKRINCPLDPKHTIFEHQLSKHLKRCNATKKKQLVYYEENINIGLKNYKCNSSDNIPISCVEISVLKDLINRIEILYKILTEDVKEFIGMHEVLENEIDTNKQYGDSVKKHLLQQGCLVKILEENNSLSDNQTFLEFGAGRGGLSHWVQKSMKKSDNSQFLLVDRQHNRNKFDCYHKGVDQGPHFQRLNIDIQHLNLEKVESLNDKDNDIVAIGKHLCGGATDLSLTCLLGDDAVSNSSSNDPPEKKTRRQSVKSRLRCCLFALCCYHHCTWPTYVGRSLFEKHGFTSLDFVRITKMAAWSTCGFERRKEAIHRDAAVEIQSVDKKLYDGGNTAVDSMIEEEKSVLKEHSKETSPSISTKADVETIHEALCLTTKEQIEIGKKCKRLIDYGRLDFIHRHGFTCELIQYISEDITPENIALVVTRIK